MEDKPKFRITKSHVVSTFLLLVAILIFAVELNAQMNNSTLEWPKIIGMTGVALIFFSLSRSPNLIFPAEDGSVDLSTASYVYSVIAAVLIVISLIWTLIDG